MPADAIPGQVRAELAASDGALEITLYDNRGVALWTRLLGDGEETRQWLLIGQGQRLVVRPKE